MIRLPQTKTADTEHMGIFASVTRPFYPIFRAGLGDEANGYHALFIYISTTIVYMQL